MDDEIFLSTQIQSRLDDAEREDEHSTRRPHSFLQRFVHDEVPTTTTTTTTTTNIVSKPRVRASTAPRKRKQQQRSSVTEKKVVKLSGKPQKCRKMSSKRSATGGDTVHTQEYNRVFSAEEWARVRYTFGSHGTIHTGLPTGLPTGMPTGMPTGLPTGMWSMACDSPVAGSELGDLYGDVCGVRTPCEAAMTLSQCLALDDMTTTTATSRVLFVGDVSPPVLRQLERYEVSVERLTDSSNNTESNNNNNNNDNNENNDSENDESEKVHVLLIRKR